MRYFLKVTAYDYVTRKYYAGNNDLAFTKKNHKNNLWKFTSNLKEFGSSIKKFGKELCCAGLGQMAPWLILTQGPGVNGFGLNTLPSSWPWTKANKDQVTVSVFKNISEELLSTPSVLSNWPSKVGLR